MLIAQLNRYLQRALERSPRARSLCAALEGRQLTIEIEGWPEPLRLRATGGALQLDRGAARTDATAAATAAASASAGAAADGDAQVRGSAPALWALATGRTEAGLAGEGIGISGDEQVARQFQELARLLRPDPEAEAARWLGPIPAHLAARAIGGLAAWTRAAGESLLRSGAEYLAHESRDLVPRAEAEGYLGGVEALRAELARAEARAARLAERLGQLERHQRLERPASAASPRRNAPPGRKAQPGRS